MTDIDGIDLPMNMTVKPYGWPFMGSDFFSCAHALANQKGMAERFLKETGLTMPKFDGIEGMIDEASGYQKDVLGKYLDWVSENYWGKEE